MGLPKENDLMATTSEQITEPESKFGAQKNLMSLTFSSINIVLIDHVICHMTYGPSATVSVRLTLIP